MQYLIRNTNQLYCYDPARSTWENVESSGSVPSPRHHACAAKIGDKVWLHGGICDVHVNDFYELNMVSLIWTQIQISLQIFRLKLVPITTNQLLLHNFTINSTSEMWIFDVESHTLRQKSMADDSNLVLCTATTGLNGEVVVLGGIKINKNTYRPQLSVKLEPSSLQQLAMRTIFKYKDMLPFNSLPSKLIRKMELHSPPQSQLHWLPPGDILRCPPKDL